MAGSNISFPKETQAHRSTFCACAWISGEFQYCKLVHWQPVTVIKCSFISSPATTKGQNRIKQRRGMLPLLMLRPFENLLAVRAATVLEGRITEQRDVGIWNEVREPPHPLPSLLSRHPHLLNASHAIKFCSVEGHRPPRLLPSCWRRVVCRQLSWSWGQQADMVHLSRERNIHSSRGRCVAQWRQLSVR